MLDDSKLLNHYAKLKLAHEDAIPIKVVIGQKEVDDDFAELRQLATKVAKRVGKLPFIRREWPAEISKRL